jgi:hypothetical protein
MMRLATRQIRKAAWHEAGHATHCLATINASTLREFGYPAFEGIWVRRDTDEECPVPASAFLSDYANHAGIFFPTGRPIFCSVRTQIVTLMAGLAGERVMRKTKTAGKMTVYDSLAGCKSDYLAAMAALKEHALGESFLTECLNVAWNMLRLYAGPHREIAQRLVKQGYVSYEEAHAIWEAASYRLEIRQNTARCV